MMTRVAVLFCLFLFVDVSASATQSRPSPQNPSPMVDYVRAHERIPPQNYPGYHFEIKSLLPKPIDVYIPSKVAARDRADLLIHFHGSENVVDYAAERYHGYLIAVTINLGKGSAVYAKPFSNPAVFGNLLDALRTSVREHVHHAIRFHHVFVSAWSAGYGAVRAILKVPSNVKRIDGVLLLDALYGSYVPQGKVLARGGKIDTSEYTSFLDFCQLAVQNDSTKKFLFTHTEIFPGTFVSTKESAHYLLQKLGIKVHPVLKWGPLGTQQISDAKENHFEIMGFAGNSAPDHVDQLEGLYYFLNRLQKE